MPVDVRFGLVDVFASQPLSGNPLAVVPDAAELDEATMRALAVEFNQSETTFVLPPTVPDARWWLRSFTPSGEEVTGAGHNALGAWWWLAANGQVDVGGPGQRQQLGTRSLHIRVTGGTAPERITMQQEPARIGEPLADRAELAEALGISQAQLDGAASTRVVSTGVAHLMVGVRDRQTLDALTPDPAALGRVLGAAGAQGCYVFTEDTVSPAAQAYARFFNPTVGIREDAATGSAAGPLAALLVGQDRVRSATTSVVIEQGFAMQRPSQLEVTVSKDGIELTGSCVIVGQGTLHL